MTNPLINRTYVDRQTPINADWLNGVNDTLLTLNTAYTYNTNKTRVDLLSYIPTNLWAGLATGTDTTDIGPYINQAIADLASTGGEILLPSWTLCLATEVTWSVKGIVLKGIVPKEGITTSSAVGTCLKWTGSVGATMVSVTNGGHNARVEGIMFDANDRANTCLAFFTTGGAVPQQIHMPSASNLRFNGYRGAALVFGNPNTTVNDTGQFQQAEIHDISWWGGGATATPTNVFGMILNAQNCEVLTAYNLFFDPYTAIGGGPNINHYNHIKIRTGGLNLRGVTFTRSTDYNILVVSECGLIVDQARTEDPLFLYTNAGQPSNPISITNIEGRDGSATGAEQFIRIASGGTQAITLEGIKSTGHVWISGADVNHVFARNIIFVTPGTSTLSITGGTPYVGKYVLEASPGEKTVINDNAVEEWKTLSNTRSYYNSNGKVQLTSLQKIGSSALGTNLCGVATISGAATSVTVTLPTTEPDANYRPIVAPFAETGTPAAGSNRVKSNMTRNAGDFTFNVEVAPGIGNTVTFVWLLLRT